MVTGSSFLLESHAAPIEVRLLRGEAGEEGEAGEAVESSHACHAVVCKADGKGQGEILASFGDCDLPVFPRSSIKMLQAVAFAEDDVAQSLLASCGREQDGFALACGSHAGEEGHVALVRRWLDALGLEERHLACGAHAPLDKGSAAELVRQGEQPRAVHHMCSGKHCGMLTLARARGWEVEGYVEHDHPVQRRVREVCEDFFALDLTRVTRGRDGCSVPTFSVPLRALARGMTCFAMREASGKKNGRAMVMQKLFDAVISRPFYVAGSRQADTLMVERGGGKFAVKSGAEGVYTAVVPDMALGIAVKCWDGSGRAARAAMALLLKEAGLLRDGGRDYGDEVMKNFRGLRVGRIEARLPT